MKILIIDDNADYKCREIVEVCRSREIDVVVKTYIYLYLHRC